MEEISSKRALTYMDSHLLVAILTIDLLTVLFPSLMQLDARPS